ncbi:MULTISPECIES: HD-GYP domain-containing protein [Clostridium]|uniref:HD-GYP domain-containing protein n=1 Tax=Clostridium aquiflavi TaxID=3073603 RepID=A0ABU1EJD9_9CLOT|nr:HD-GYP domain-containing protein [Clostridium sp. 5N-1]MDR5588513.1 HD-GYP domain-containing protein [Clostridium sp. 5N-1]
MEKKLMLLKISDLKTGMVIGEDVQENNNVLLSKNVVISDKILNKLQTLYNIDEVWVYGEDSLEKAENSKKNSEREFKKVEHKLNEICEDLHDVLDNTVELQKDSLKEIRKLISELQNVIKIPEILIDNLLFYGSENDSIYRHSLNVASISSLLGKWIGFEENKIKLLIYSALLHDIGKCKIDDKIINKSGRLNSKDLKKIKEHPVLGYKIIKKINFLDKSVSQSILLHHEREDGSGYPLGITGDKIPDFAKVIAIADVFEAINSNRCYRNKKSPFEAIQIIKEESFGKLDYNYCNIFLEHIVNYYIGREVKLNNNKIAKIVQMNINELDRPFVFLENEFLDLKENKDLIIEQFIL